jgi:hypothetical protein
MNHDRIAMPVPLGIVEPPAVAPVRRRPPSISSTGMVQQVVTGTANTELIEARTGSRINLRGLQVGCRNATAVIVTLYEGQIARWTVQLNANLGWWFEPPGLPTADDVNGAIGGILFQTPGNFNFTGDAAGATIDLIATYRYVEIDRIPNA